MVNPVIQLTAQGLKEIKLLSCFNEQELQALMNLGETRSYEAHANLVIEGEPSWGLYCILEGAVGIYKSNPLSGDTFDVGQLRAGQFFGEMSLVDDYPRSATVRALTACRVFYISKDQFNSFLKSNAQLQVRFYQNCVEDLVRRLRELDENYVVTQYQLWKTAINKDAA